MDRTVDYGSTGQGSNPCEGTIYVNEEGKEVYLQNIHVAYYCHNNHNCYCMGNNW